MTRRVPALRPLLVTLLLLAAAPPVEAGPDIAWEVRLLEASWISGEPEASELLLDAGADLLDRKIAIEQGSFLGALTGLPLGPTVDAGGATVVFPVGESFTVESAGGRRPITLDLAPRPHAGRPGSWTVDLKLRAGERLRYERSLPLQAHRARLWVLPSEAGVLAVLVEAWPANQPPPMVNPQDIVRVDLAIVLGDWRRARARDRTEEADFPTWLDPFGLEVGESATALMRPVSAGVVDAGTLLLTQSLKVPIGQVGAYQRGLRPDEAGEGGKDFFSATVSVREAAPGSSRLLTTLALQSADLGSAESVMMRRLELEDGATQVWLLPTEDYLGAVFVRVRRGHAGVARAIH